MPVHYLLDQTGLGICTYQYLLELQRFTKSSIRFDFDIRHFDTDISIRFIFQILIPCFYPIFTFLYVINI